MYRNMIYRQSFDKLELFVRLAGVQGEVEKFAQTNKSGSLVSIAVKGTQLYAQQGYYSVEIDGFFEQMRSQFLSRLRFPPLLWTFSPSLSEIPSPQASFHRRR